MHSVITARALGESKPLFIHSDSTTRMYWFLEERSKLLSGKQYRSHIWKYITLRQVNFNLMSDEINYSTQMSSKKHAVNKTTIKFFANHLLKAAVAYGCNPSIKISQFLGPQRPGSVPSKGERFSCCFFFNCQTRIHEEPGSIPCSGEFFSFW